MSIDCDQLRDIIIKPTLTALGMNSPSAVNLMLGTCAQETNMGRYIVQKKITFRGGIGIYQLQRAAYDMLWTRMILPDASMKAKMKLLLNYSGKPPAERLASDLMLATAMTRLYYWAINRPLPAYDDLPALADYWKDFYNTRSGKGTTQLFVENYRVYVMNED